MSEEEERKVAHRRTVDHGNPMGRWHILRSLGVTKPNKKFQHLGIVRPESSYLIDLLPPKAYPRLPAVNLPGKFVHLSANKAKHAIQAISWTPEGRRVLSGSNSGEFTLWNGMTFNFETIMQAHESAITAIKYSYNKEWLLSADQDGTIKYWQPNFNNVNIIKGAHSDAIRDVCFSPNDSKFVSCSDDNTLKIWNFNNGLQESVLAGHHWDVKSCDWHPDLGLIVSGSKDNLLKLWDPRTSPGKCIATLHGFKHTITATRFQNTESSTKRLLASGGRDRSIRVFDLRKMNDVYVNKSHESDVSCISWHPIHGNLLTSGGYDGSMNYYLLDDTLRGQEEQNMEFYHKIPYAHEKSVNCIEYHPLGHLLATAGTDRSVRFWCRNRPNDPYAFKDTTYTNEKSGTTWYYELDSQGQPTEERKDAPTQNRMESLPGLGQGQWGQ
ncbi:BA75_04307T0 [Komagataella pastoris]|uniref:Polyadenylation factor subunit 2 n=1 Tax=Komagataella pastoris TaxID=4922 RepID=A0A1B2JGC7_PICPA|nr:BA75_04307T0 [Komagataella pastoris]